MYVYLHILTGRHTIWRTKQWSRGQALRVAQKFVWEFFFNDEYFFRRKQQSRCTTLVEKFSIACILISPRFSLCDHKVPATAGVQTCQEDHGIGKMNLFKPYIDQITITYKLFYNWLNFDVSFVKWWMAQCFYFAQSEHSLQRSEI